MTTTVLELSGEEAAVLSSLLHMARGGEHPDPVVERLADRLPATVATAREVIFPDAFSVKAERIGGRGWGSTRITVSREGREALSYDRSYPSYGEATFAPFRTPDGTWLALASRNYTCTELVRVEDGEWIGGEKPDGLGFCPVELLVPRWRAYRYPSAPDLETQYVTECEDDRRLEKLRRMAELGKIEFGEEGWMPIGFVAGCIWGDDTSWKVEAFDLSRASDGILTRIAPWGYAPLPPNSAGLREALHYDEYWEPGETLCGLAQFSLADSSRDRREGK